MAAGESIVQGGFKNPCSEFIESFFSSKSSPPFPPFRPSLSCTCTLVITSTYVSSLDSLTNLLHFHISYLASNLPMASIAYRTKFISSSKSDNGFYYVAFACELVSSHSWFMAKQATCSPHYALSCLRTWAHVGLPLWEALFCWEMSTCPSRYRSILSLLSFHGWVSYLD